MKTFITLITLAVFIATAPAFAMAGKQPKSTTTAEAAKAKKREGRTGTSNKNAARQLEKLMKSDSKKKNNTAPRKLN